AERCRARSQADRLPHLGHRLARDGTGARVTAIERAAGVGRSERGAPGADRRQLGLDVLDRDLLALEAADARGPAALLLIAKLLGGAVEPVEGEVRRAVVRLPRIGAPGAPRIGHHAGELP